MLVLAGSWWTFVLRGLIAILFGILIFLRPGMGLVTLVFLYGFYALTDGVFSIAAAFRRTGAGQQSWGVLSLHGLFGIVAGLLAFFLPGVTAIVLLYIIAAWAVVTGATQIAAAVRLRKHITGEWILALSGALSVVFGVLLFFFPGPGALAVVFWIGAYAIAFGALLVALGLRLRRWVRNVDHLSHGGPAVAHGH